MRYRMPLGWRNGWEGCHGQWLGADGIAADRSPSTISHDGEGLNGRGLGLARHAKLAAHPLFDGLVDLGVVLEELLRVFAALTESLAAVGEPGAALFDDPLVDGQVEQVAGLRNAFPVHDVELGLSEWRRDLVLYDLDARSAADHHIAVLDARDAADVHAHRRVELQRAAASGRFGVAEHDADLFAQLVDEDQAALRLRHRARELPERLRHQPRLQAHLRFAHLAFDFCPGHQRRDRVDDDHVDAVRADEHLDDLERLLAVVRLRHEQVVDVDAQFLRVRGVERVLRVDERRHAAQFLRFSDHLQRQRRLARRFRAKDFDDPPARHAADSESEIDADGARGDEVNRLDGALLAQAHDRALPELLFDLTEGDLHGLLAFSFLTFVSLDRRHGFSSRRA